MKTQAIVERLEFVSKRVPNLRFTTPTQINDDDLPSCYMSCDMFYIEIKLDNSRQMVNDVIVSHTALCDGGLEGGISCPVLKQVLREQDFETFAKHLLGFHSIYQINTNDKKLKQRAYPVLSALEQDLLQLDNIQRNTIKDCFTLTHKGPIGVLEPRKGGFPVKLYFFVSPFDLVDPDRKCYIEITKSEVIDKNLGISCSVEIEGAPNPQTVCRLQMKSVCSENTSNGKSLPAYIPLNNENSEKLPAYFLLKLSQPMPLSTSLSSQLVELANKVGEPPVIKDYLTTLTNSKESLIGLIVKQSLDATKNSSKSFEINRNQIDVKKQTFQIELKGEQHSYLIDDTHFERQEGSMVEKIPFTHPTSIPNIIQVLRQQALFNSIMASFIRPKSKTNTIVNDVEQKESSLFEVYPINISTIYVSFEQPYMQTLATLELDLKDINELKCQLHSQNLSSLCSNLFATKVLQKCWSIPITMRSVLKKCNLIRETMIEEEKKKREKEFEIFLKNQIQNDVNGPSNSGNHSNSKSDPLQQSSLNNVCQNFSTTNILTKQEDTASIEQTNKLKKIKLDSTSPQSLEKVINKVNSKEAHRKASLSKKPNTILMSMLEDVPAGAEIGSSKGIKRSRVAITKKVPNNLNESGKLPTDQNSVANKQYFEQKDPNKMPVGTIKSRIPRPVVDQFAIKQGSTGLKLTVKKTKPSSSTTNNIFSSGTVVLPSPSPNQVSNNSETTASFNQTSSDSVVSLNSQPSTSTPQSTAASTTSTNPNVAEATKLFNSTPLTAGIKYKIPKISKTQGPAQSSANNTNSVDQNISNSTNNDNCDPGSSVSSANTINASTNKRANNNLFGRNNNQQRNSVTSSTHPFSRPTINPLSFAGSRPASLVQQSNRVNNFQQNAKQDVHVQISQPTQQSPMLSLNQGQNSQSNNSQLRPSNPTQSQISYNILPAPTTTPNSSIFVPALTSIQPNHPVLQLPLDPAIKVDSQCVRQEPDILPMRLLSNQLTTNTNYICDNNTTSLNINNNNNGQQTKPVIDVPNVQITNKTEENRTTNNFQPQPLATPSSPTDCNLADTLPPPPMIPIDVPDEKNKLPIASPDSEHQDDLSERLSIDVNEGTKSAISSQSSHLCTTDKDQSSNHSIGIFMTNDDESIKANVGIE